MLSSKFISPSIYNELPGINDNEVLHEDTLLALDQLFTAFKVKHLIGVGLLHKHFRLTPDNIMVHNGSVCKPESIQSSTHATGTSFFWDGSKFQAFEYGHGEPLSLPTDFLSSFAGHLESHSLCGGVALVNLGCDPVTRFDTRRDGDPETAVYHFEGPCKAGANTS